MNIEKTIVDLLVQICGTKKVQKDLKINLIQEGFLDSMRIVELLTEIEDEFDIEIPLQMFDPDDFCTAEKIISFIKNNIDDKGID